MKKLSISVMAHPSREALFPYLRHRLEGLEDTVPFSVDTGFGIWENCKRAWRMRDPEALWHVVIQDDAIVCDNFRKRAEAAIAAAQEHGCGAVSFFYGNRTMLRETAKKGLLAGYVESSWLHWGVAVCMRAGLVEDMIAAGDKQNIKQDDARIANFFKQKGVKIYYPIPSLVDHRAGKSLVGDPGENRHAFAFIDTP